MKEAIKENMLLYAREEVEIANSSLILGDLGAAFCNIDHQGVNDIQPRGMHWKRCGITHTKVSTEALVNSRINEPTGEKHLPFYNLLLTLRRFRLAIGLHLAP